MYVLIGIRIYGLYFNASCMVNRAFFIIICSLYGFVLYCLRSEEVEGDE